MKNCPKLYDSEKEMFSFVTYKRKLVNVSSIVVCELFELQKVLLYVHIFYI